MMKYGEVSNPMSRKKRWRRRKNKTPQKMWKGDKCLNPRRGGKFQTFKFRKEMNPEERREWDAEKADLREMLAR